LGPRDPEVVGRAAICVGDEPLGDLRRVYVTPFLEWAGRRLEEIDSDSL
jgi:hypothetical protein